MYDGLVEHLKSLGLIYITLKIATQNLRFFPEWRQVENLAITSNYLSKYNDLVYFSYVYQS